MKILSVYPWTHISSSALMINGKVVTGSPEERFNKIKYSTAFPIQSADWCLKNNNLKWEDLDLIVVPWNPMHNINHANSRWDSTMTWRGQMLSHVPTNIMRAIKGNAEKQMEVSFGKTRIIYMNHHDCHAASAIYCSPFNTCDYLTIDGHGELETCTAGTFSNKKIKKNDFVLYPHSVGLFYGSLTNFLGFRPDQDEWKTMALASSSKTENIYDNKMKKLFKLTNKSFELDLSYFDYYLFDKRADFYNSKFVQEFGQPRKPGSKLNQRHSDIAGALQRSFEKIVFHLLNVLKKNGTKSGNLVLAGGAAMNCVFNGLLDEKKIYKNNFIPPWPDDLGVTIGALYLANQKYNAKKIKPKRIRSAYLGPSYNDDKILDTINKFKLKYKKPKNLLAYTAGEIAKKKLIGWFQGKMEFTHRALGNRSILADPRGKSIQNTINSAVKYRESFRPFAPAVLEEDAHEIFHLDKNMKIDFMEKAVKVRKNWRGKIPAVTHVDNTARVQTVSKDYNKMFYELLKEFKKQTNVPVLVNTSFNLNGQPIVLDPSDAIKTFYTCGLDILVIGSYVIEK